MVPGFARSGGEAREAPGHSANTETMKWMLSGLLLAAALLAWQCTPKAGKKTQSDEVGSAQPAPQKQEAENLSPCPRFADAPNPDGALENYVLYRDFLKAGDWEQAYSYWQNVYEVAPAADGRRNTVLADGIRFMEYFFAQSEGRDSSYVDRIFELYDQIDKCYPEGGYVAARKAFDLYYKYPGRATRMATYRLFKKALDTDGLDAPDFALNPLASLLVELYFDDEIPMAEAQKYQQQVRDILAKGLAECEEGVDCERWRIVDEYAPDRLQAFESVEGFYDCEYYMDKYYPEFLADSTDCDNVRTVYSRLSWGGCPKDDPRFARLIRLGNENCAPAGSLPAKQAYECLKQADYDCAITSFEKAAAETDDLEKKGKYLLLIAKIYQAHKINFPRSRAYALQAAEARPGWGEPYIHIGRLYASSGPLCGPGRGWDSQVVVWPALDMWTKAKSIDPSVAAEANKWIRQYSQYMPKKEDVFQRLKKVGESYFVGCWIQRSTVIRTAD